jgi:hypothetical protein
MKTALQRLGWALAACSMLCAVGCEDTEPTPEQRQAVETAVDGYLHALAETYSTLDTEYLEDWATPNEIAAVVALLRKLSRTGDRIDSTLRGYEVMHLEIFREVNATVRLVEVWDVVRYDADTGIEKGRTDDSIQNTILQLRLIDGDWKVTGRSVLARETPIPEEEGSVDL